MEEPIKTGKPRPLSLIILFVILIGGFIYWWLVVREEATDTNQNANKVLNLPKDTTPPSQSTNPDASQRDSDRLYDVRTLLAALKKYFEANKEYPATLEELVTAEELESIPINPEPGGQAYDYTPTDPVPYQNYQLCYSLEIGIEGVSAGEHCATFNSLTGRIQPEPDWDAIINKNTNN